VPVKAEYLMIGGFLGAGKTTALLQLARRLSAQGRRVGLIANDQSHGLADTALLAAHGFPVKGIAGGCFCRRFDSLTQAVERLTQRAAPDVILGEPVGSCTDLRATVQYPLVPALRRSLSGGPAVCAGGPAARAAHAGRGIGPAVFDQGALRPRQATGRGGPDRHQQVRPAGWRTRLPTGTRVSARDGTGLDRWLAAWAAEAGSPAAPQVDYDLYADQAGASCHPLQ